VLAHAGESSRRRTGDDEEGEALIIQKKTNQEIQQKKDCTVQWSPETVNLTEIQDGRDFRERTERTRRGEFVDVN